MPTYEVVVLKEGYCRHLTNSQFESDCTITLIKGPLNIIVDTGNPSNKGFILKALADHLLSPEDIHYVICTHGHLDHVGNLNLFPKATVIVGHDICRGCTYDNHDFKSGRSFEVDECVEVISTPGHTSTDVSVVVRDSKLDTVIIAGDIFECEADMEDPSIWAELSENPDQQEQSRIKIMTMADVIIPGHGPMFHVKPNYTRHLSITEVEKQQETFDQD